MKWNHTGDRCDIGGNTGCLLIFGALFAGIGLLFCYFLWTDPASVTVNDRPGTREDIWLPLIFVAIGLGIMGIRYRRQIQLDGASLRSRRSAGWGPFLSHKTIDHGLIEAVRLSKEIRRSSSSNGGSSTRTVYPVSAVCGVEACAFEEPGRYEVARRLAEDLATRFKVPCVDESTGDRIERDWQDLDRPVVELCRDETLDQPAPADSRVRVEEDGYRTVVRLPRSPASFLAKGFVLLPVLLFPLGFWWFFWFPTFDEEDVAEGGLFLQIFRYAPLIMFIGLPALVIVPKALFGGLSERLVIDDRFLRLGVKRIPLGAIEELTVVDGPDYKRHLLIASDDARLTVAKGYAAEDLAHLRRVVLRALREAA